MRDDSTMSHSKCKEKCLITNLNLDFNKEFCKYDIGVYFKERILYSLAPTYTRNNSKIN